jgi:hypothetical protein
VIEETSPYLVESVRSGVRHAVTVATGADTTWVGNARKAPNWPTSSAERDFETIRAPSRNLGYETVAEARSREEVAATSCRVE